MSGVASEHKRAPDRDGKSDFLGFDTAWDHTSHRIAVRNAEAGETDLLGTIDQFLRMSPRAKEKLVVTASSA